MQPVTKHLPWHEEASGVANLAVASKLKVVVAIILLSSLIGLAVLVTAIGYAIGVGLARIF